MSRRYHAFEGAFEERREALAKHPWQATVLATLAQVWRVVEDTSTEDDACACAWALDAARRVATGQASAGEVRAACAAAEGARTPGVASAAQVAFHVAQAAAWSHRAGDHGTQIHALLAAAVASAVDPLPYLADPDDDDDDRENVAKLELVERVGRRPR